MKWQFSIHLFLLAQLKSHLPTREVTLIILYFYFPSFASPSAFQPIAAGSGIPQIKCYLNGVKIPRVVRLKVHKHTHTDTCTNTHRRIQCNRVLLLLCLFSTDTGGESVWCDLLCCRGSRCWKGNINTVSE